MHPWWWIASMTALASIILFLHVRHRRAMVDVLRALESLAAPRPIRPVRASKGAVSIPLAEWIASTAPVLQSRLERLDREHRQLQTVLAGMTEGVLAVDDRMHLLYANDAARRLFGLVDNDLGRLLPELIRSPQINETLAFAAAGNSPETLQVAFPGPDVLSPHRDRILTIRARPTPAASSPGAVLVFHDETELRRLERMRQDFVANASHELKTPLASIKANTETLLEWALADEAVNVLLLRQIDEQVDRLDALIQDMLSLARIESGQETYPLRPIALRPTLAPLLAAHESRARAKGLDFQIDLEALPMNLLVRAGEEPLRQIIDNLIDNAIKYTPAGGRVRVAARRDGSVALLVVSDTGVGIPREDQPRVFERFYRVDKARSRAVGGTGLGLSIVKHAAQTLGGQVAVESSPTLGSTFSVRLPVLSDEDSRISGPAL